MLSARLFARRFSAKALGRRAAAGIIVAGVAGVGLADTAAADPGCTVADMTAVETGVETTLGFDTAHAWIAPA